MKYDADGEVVWNKNFGGSGSDEFQSLALTDDGGYIATGSFYSIDGDFADLFNEYRGRDDWDAVYFSGGFVVKYDADGEVVWIKIFGSFRQLY